SPLRGSSVARQLSRWPAGRRLLGAAENTLIEGIRGWPGGREVGMIAGTLSMGLGVFAGGARLKSDGTVLAEESHHPALNDLVEIRTSHTGMLFSAEVARQAGQFLKTGRFEHGPE
ncbi:MAG: alpha/beta hydrolase, partial [Xanthomonadales bacterium]|nr:alpha/beta hydrolase [Xanthomonadales bacterium]